MRASRISITLSLLVGGLLSNAATAVNIDLVNVGDAGNSADTRYYGMGGVGYTYRMGKFEITAGQYCDFLNAVARLDPHGLYNGSSNIQRSLSIHFRGLSIP